ncbi:hypothetical protein Godav_019499, partial [Gossypium davidsonii]|nr:hypothetical protein [Gossypium davidsonii]
MDIKDSYKINQEELDETLSLCDLSLENYQDLDDTSHHSLNSPSYGHQFFEFPIIPSTPLNNNKANDIVFCGKLIKEQGFVHGDNVNPKPNSTKSFRSQSSSFRKYKVLIGISKIELKMELNDMTKRQSRRNHPLPMFPPVATGDMAVVEAGDGCDAGGKRGRRWSLLRPLKFSVLPK